MDHEQSTSRGGRGAFTIVEVIVAVGVMALLTIGISAIFSKVGETVAVGRSVSQLNRSAVQIEQQLRRDFDRLTRDGFMVIRHQYATDARGRLIDVPLFEGDPNPRPRRIDEFMFFASGDFSTARLALHPAMIARGNQARVYFGHGQRAILDLTNDTTEYLKPTIGSLNLDSGALLGLDPAADPSFDPFQVNPNRFASDWALLRHQTVLKPLTGDQSQTLPREVYDLDRRNPVHRMLMVDGLRQVGLQPAVASVFGNFARPTLQELLPAGVLPSQNLGVRDVGATNRTLLENPPRFASGLVDVATTSLAEIEHIVTTELNEQHSRFRDDINPAELNRKHYYGVGGAPQMRKVDNHPSPVFRMRGWMEQAMPSFRNRFNPLVRSRIRYEMQPPRQVIPPSVTTDEMERAYLEADLEMLTSSVFVPRCTEFIVEWSFGWVYDNGPNNVGTAYFVPFGDPRYKQLVWFGRERRVADNNGDGKIDKNDVPLVVAYAPRVENGTDPNNFVNTRLEGAEEWVIVGRPAGTGPDDTQPNQMAIPETAMFGYFDPGGDPQDPGGSLENPEDDEMWPWPRFIRITMGLADPNDPKIERSYQVVFEVPAAGEN